MEAFSLESYLSNGVANIMKGIIKASAKNPKASIFMAKHSMDSAKARKRRQDAERAGNHIPPFLIASITHQCNLHCKGCYARANHSCGDSEVQNGLLTAEQWGNIFSQAVEMGIEFVLLAGGEPFIRRDVLELAGRYEKILFPIFTNGTMIDERYMSLLEAHRNLMPVISMEGNEQTTDARRGKGIYRRIETTMNHLHNAGILFGVSVTVTKENLKEVLSLDFIKELEQRGTKAAVYVEYVPVDGTTQELAPDDADRAYMMERLAQLRSGETQMVLIAFPGDEKTSGGCLAAGRGFFHINAAGGAEPCPFSPFSDTNLKETSLEDALKSPLFRKLQTSGNLTKEHIGGCVLFEQRDQVALFLEEKDA